MTTLEYFKRLAMALRHRKLTEEQTAEVLWELQSHLQETGQSPEEAFGSPKDYAARYPKGAGVPRGTMIGRVALAVLLVLIAIRVIGDLVLGYDMDLMTALLYHGGTLVLLAVLFIWMGAKQSELPEGLTEKLSGKR